jgi:S1-C subfamily serine protease
MSRPFRLAALALALAAPLAAATGAQAQKPPPLPPAGGDSGGGATPDLGKPPPLGRADPAPAPPPPAARPPARPPGTAARPPAGTPGKPPPLAPGETPGPSGGREASSGTGFVIGAHEVLTNHHVADGCTGLRLRLSTGNEVEARMVASDAEADLALLKTSGTLGPALSFRRSIEMRRGDGVVTYGFPLSGILSSGPTLTTGDISALQGLRDNDKQFQISAPVQPGNSGGPLLDLAGNVVGIIVSKLNAQRIAQRTGDIPQNVNFAVKGDAAIDFLRAHQVEPQLSTRTTARTPADVGEIAHPSTVFVRCMR